MLFTQALLVTLVGIIATIDYNGPLFMIHRIFIIVMLISIKISK